MRIVHITHEFPPYELAGTAIYTQNIAKAQAAAGHEVWVFARHTDSERPAYHVHEEQRDGLRIRFVNKVELDWHTFDRTYRDERFKALLGEFLDEMKPDIVHFQHLIGLGLGCVEAVVERGLKRVFTLHDFWLMCPMGQRLCYTDLQICDPIKFEKCGPCVFGSGWQDPGEDKPADPAHPPGVMDRFEGLYRGRVASTPGRFARRPRALIWAARHTLRSLGGRLFGNADARPAAPPSRNPFVIRFEAMRQMLTTMDLLITPSAFLRDQFIEHFRVSPDRIIHSANGMDLSYIERLPKSPSPALRFGFVGSVIRTKGIHVLAEAFLRAVKGRVDLELHVFGAPNRWTTNYHDELVQMTGHCPYVKFHGRFDNKQISRVLQQIDVLVLPSIWYENAPLTLNEAAIAQTPILVSDKGGMLEFVRCNQYGWTFKIGDPEDLAQKMLRLADDRSLVPTLGGNPPRIKSVEANATELTAIYRRIIDGTWRTPAPSSSPRADTAIASH
jgi:glycosyltransferase involved in cell wall biosynthesis